MNTADNREAQNTRRGLVDSPVPGADRRRGEDTAPYRQEFDDSEAAGSGQRPLVPKSPGSDPIRARILRTAAERFFAQGFSTITMDELARDLGMSKKTLYQHFPTKEELLSGVIHAKASDIRGTLESITSERHSTYADKVRNVISALAFKLAEIQPIFIHNLRRYAPAHYEEVDRIRRQNFTQIFSRLLQEGKECNQVRPDLDIPFTVELFLRTFNSMIDSDTLNRFQLTPGRAMQMALNLFFEGVLNRQK